MGEAKRNADRMTPYERMLQELTRKLVDDGKLIEAGWVGLRKMWLTRRTRPTIRSRICAKPSWPARSTRGQAS